MESLVGQTLDGKYSIRFEIGRGGMGAVYYAVHLGTKRPVAVKVIVPKFMAHTEFVERFRREAEASGRLCHPNVVDVTDFGFADTQSGRVAYLVMEYLDGCTLGEILKEEKKLSLAWTVDIMEQVCLAISEAHKHGVIHRDLKPDNIWLEPNQRGGYTIKVLDFGLAKLENPTIEYSASGSQNLIPPSGDVPPTYFVPADTDPTEAKTTIGFDTFNERSTAAIPRPQVAFSNTPVASAPVTDKSELSYERSTADITRVGAIMGTPLYMSPEQCRGERPGFTSDIYSLGVITYQMLSGQTPFSGEHISVIANHLETSPPRLRGRVPRRVKRVVHSALEKEPLRRPESAEIFSSLLRAHSEGILSIVRRSFSIYIESFTKILPFSLILYFPTILLAVVTFLLAVAQFNGVFSARVLPTVYSVLQAIVKHTNIALTTSAETLVGAMVAWTIVQYIDAPLRSYKVSKAVKALAEKWRHLIWIIPLRMMINVLLQGDLFASAGAAVLLLSFLDTLAFWFVPCVVMMESYSGLKILKRNWNLTWRVFGTVTLAALVNLIIYSVLGITVAMITFNISALITSQVFPSAFALEVPEFSRLIEGLGLMGIKIVGAFVLPFFGVITALVYLKARQAGGESIGKMFEAFRQGEVLQSNWQKRIRIRSTGGSISTQPLP